MRIFGSDHSSHHVGRDLVQGNVCPAARIGIQQFIQDIAFPVQNAGRFELGSPLLQVLDIREGRGNAVVIVDRKGASNDRQHDSAKYGDHQHAQDAPKALPARPSSGPF